MKKKIIWCISIVMLLVVVWGCIYGYKYYYKVYDLNEIDDSWCPKWTSHSSRFFEKGYIYPCKSEDKIGKYCITCYEIAPEACDCIDTPIEVEIPKSIKL